MSELALKEKVALITGSGQGVGQGIALALARAGAKIMLSGRTESKLKTTQELIQKIGGEAQIAVCDVCSNSAIAELVATTIKHYKTLDILVNNAQSVVLGPLLNNTDKDYELVMNSGPRATFSLMRLCYPYLKKSKGSIINLGSSSALRWDMKNYGLYAAAKEAIRSFTRAAAHEWAVDGIRVNCVLPLAMSPGMEWWTKNNPEEAKKFISEIPMGRVGDCEKDIGRTVVFLCGDDASYITAQSLLLDGGQARLA